MPAPNLIQHSRREAGLTQRELAARSGVAQPAIAKIEKGHICPRVDTLERLLRACGKRLAVAPERGRGIDRTAIRDLLRLSPEERLERAAVEGRNLDALVNGLQI